MSVLFWLMELITEARIIFTAYLMRSESSRLILQNHKLMLFRFISGDQNHGRKSVIGRPSDGFIGFGVSSYSKYEPEDDDLPVG